ncbi:MULTISPECIES: pyruvate dehydrogenase (acetyl-transferring) E1 component subunit alpha [unclassified Saccharopolyspora]|uniref:pyruvate dehydrogenase (acetyl-transferring) E1 component subunit alpha n=1 Tax=unclassified Saccharopolyspora TaxID=2646250 RepID=UPI001CD22BE6|nr:MULTISPECIES: pyruvate dehydrogenase (acetyl-transferring) E1 component subunit alpha [unclassified Saccharopolyspora]MCA1187253.1 pyruvate dehydrogenase (acetyl-transferring) E1 component subunit alpha [Saccharopolyspora sp. 6T]MCA1193666.1 pyruvate dehydrogenase (acetyl-transferring) E1 component subunit alpha [Saccharopolyspora sp. 6V]MCA1228153.1 pyruvate dehydrogenase (acetyl-transferring) E1 component subunit alpha [Saccharopolyspora sp. 6M]
MAETATRTKPATRAKTTRRSTAKSAKSGAFSGESAELLRGYFQQMTLIRRFEERAAQGYTQAKIGGYCHLNLGEEATVVGLMSALRKTDLLFTNYREHGYALAKGIEPGRVMAELYGRTTGTSKGWGGSMHMFDVEAGLLGGYGIVGGQIPLATGAAMAIDYRGGDQVVMCQMGDGTTNIGAFHEALNIAALWNLPVVFVVVNNFLGMGTTVEKSSAESELYKRASAYRMHGERVDGNDVLAVRDAATRLVERARESGGPALLEAVSHRLKGHSVVDPAKYRSEESVQEAREHDPVVTFRARLVEAGVLDEDGAQEIERLAQADADAAVAFADDSPHPEVSTLFDYTYATPVANDSRRLPADPVF